MYLSCLFICPSKWSEFSVRPALELACDSLQGCSHGSAGGGSEEDGPPRREEAEPGGRLPSHCGPGAHFAHDRAPPRSLLPGSASAHVQCPHQRGFQTCRCLFVRYLLFLTLLEFPHLWLHRQCSPLLWEGGCASQNLRGHEEDLSSLVIKNQSYQHLRDSPLGSLGSCGGRGMGFSYWKISSPKRRPLLFGGWGETKTTAGVLCTPSSRIVFISSFPWLSLRLLPCIHSLCKHLLYLLVSSMQSRVPVNSDFWIFWW